MRRVMLGMAVFCAMTVAGLAQQSSPRFEVASIKLWRPASTPVASAGVAPARGGSDRFNRTATLAGLITFAYGVRDHQLSGGPDWVRTERYEVAARAGREVSPPEVRAMVKTLLEERFTLRVQIETRELPIFELRLARSDGRVGSNLHDCANASDTEGVSTPDKPFRAPTGGSVAAADCASGLTFLVTLASRQLQATVIDKTGLTGQWRFNVFFASEPPAIPGVDLSREKANPDLPSFTRRRHRRRTEASGSATRRSRSRRGRACPPRCSRARIRDCASRSILSVASPMRT